MATRTKVLAIVLAGGEGKRLMPLTADRAKPAVPFGGPYRLIDFALSNLVNSGYLKIVVLTQYKSHSLDRHVTMTWRMSQLLGNYGQRGYTVVLLHAPAPSTPLPIPRRALTCVTLVKAVLGIDDLRVQTPYRLYKSIT